jgi:hypothetical protein
MHAKENKLKLFLKIIPVLIEVMVPISLYADCTGSNCGDEHKLRVLVGSQFTHCPPEIHYREKDTSSPREVDVRKSYAKDGYLPFAFLELEYQTNQASFWNLTYNKDESQTAALTHETLELLTFPLKLSVKVPGKIYTQSLKIFYNRTVFQNARFEFGGSLGIHVLSINARTDKPIWGREEYDYTAPLPAIGLYASYEQSDRLTYRLRTNYFSLGSLSLGSVSIGGVVAEADISIEYQYDKTWIIGAGFRLSYLKVEVEEDDYRLNGSHVTYGPKFFIGASF